MKKFSSISRRSGLILILLIPSILFFGDTFASLGRRILGAERVELDKGLIHHVKLDGYDYYDYAAGSSCTSLGGGNNGKTEVADRHNHAARALEFDGGTIGDNGVQCPHDEPENISVSAWLNLNDWRDNDDDNSHHVYPPSDGWAITTSNSNWTVWIQPGSVTSSRFTVRSSANHTLNEWHHVVMTYEQASGDLNLYVDGQLRATGNAGASTPINYGVYANFSISHSSWFTDGAIDDVRIYDRPINASEVGALYDTYEGSPIQIGDLQKDLIAHYKLDGDGNDSTPASYHGTLNGGIVSGPDRHSNAGQALDFDGSDDRIYIGSQIPPPSQYTISAWVNLDELNINGNNNYRVLVVVNSGVTAPLTMIIEQDGRLACRASGVSNTRAFSTNTISVGSWHHLACIYDQQDVTAYLDGAPGTPVNVGPGSVDWTDLAINVSNSPDSNSLDGRIDDVRLYSRALSGAEIQQLYEQYNPVVQISDLQKGLIGYFKLDEDNGDDYTPYSMKASSILTNGGVADRHGHANGAIELNGSSQRINFTSSVVGSQYVALPEISISAWIKPDDLDSGEPNHNIVTRNAPFIFGVRRGTRDIITTLFDSSTFYQYQSNDGIIQDGIWQHVAFTYDGTTTRHYYNGAEVGSGHTAMSGPLRGTTSTTLGIGYDPCCGGRHWFDGAIDDIRIYNRGLSAAEIKALYEQY